jgi:hypothetical protein
MFGVSNAWLRDAGERVAFTALEAGAATAVVLLTPLATWWAAPITVALAGVKTWAAKHKGSPDSAAFRKSSEAGGS